MDLALDGAGLIYTNEDIIAGKVRSGDLEIVLGEYAPSSEGVYLYFPQRSQVHPKLRAFIEHVKEYQRLN